MNRTFVCRFRIPRSEVKEWKKINHAVTKLNIVVGATSMSKGTPHQQLFFIKLLQKNNRMSATQNNSFKT